MWNGSVNVRADSGEKLLDDFSDGIVRRQNGRAEGHCREAELVAFVVCCGGSCVRMIVGVSETAM